MDEHFRHHLAAYLLTTIDIEPIELTEYIYGRLSHAAFLRCQSDQKRNHEDTESDARQREQLMNLLPKLLPMKNNDISMYKANIVNALIYVQDQCAHGKSPHEKIWQCLTDKWEKHYRGCYEDSESDIDLDTASDSDFASDITDEQESEDYDSEDSESGEENADEGQVKRPRYH